MIWFLRIIKWTFYINVLIPQEFAKILAFANRWRLFCITIDNYFQMFWHVIISCHLFQYYISSFVFIYIYTCIIILFFDMKYHNQPNHINICMSLRPKDQSEISHMQKQHSKSVLSYICCFSFWVKKHICSLLFHSRWGGLFIV